MGGCRYGRNPSCLSREDGPRKGHSVGYCHGEADEAAERVSTLLGELVAACRAQDAAEEKFLSLSAKSAVAE
jgi:hypothetical protein